VATLTGLAPDPRHEGCILVEVDRGRFASVPAAELSALDLEVGADLPDTMLHRLRELADGEAAYRAGLRALALRPRARVDLRRRLIQKPHPVRAVDHAIERLNNQGLIDDLRFARHYTATRSARGRGPARLLRDLLAQGVDRRTAEAGIAETLAEEGIDPVAAARAVAERRARQLEALPVPVKRRRLLAYLVRRGYEGIATRQLVDQLCQGGLNS
jgi:regulatory protein